MNLKVLFMILCYYAVISLIFLFGSSYITGITSNVDLTPMAGNVTAEESGTGGIFSIGVSVVRFVAFVGFGLTFNSAIPVWFTVIFGLWQTLFTIFSVGFIISSIWDG